MSIIAAISRHRGTGAGGSGGGGGQPVPPYLASMTLGGPNTAVLTHPAIGFTITQLDQFGIPFAGAPGPYTYLSSNTSVGTMSGNAQVGGTFTPMSAGTTQLSVQTTNSLGQTITSPSYTMTVSAQVATTATASPPSASVTVSGTQQFTAVVYDQVAGSPNAISGATGAWETTDHAKATISGGGLATGVAITSGTPVSVTFTSGAAVGTAQLIVSASSPVTAVTARFLNTTQTPNTTSTAPCLLFVGTAYQFIAQDQTNAVVTGTWGSSSTAACTITNAGVVTPVALGASTLTFTHATGLTSTIAVSVLLQPAAYEATELCAYLTPADFRNAIATNFGGTGPANAKYNDGLATTQMTLDFTRPYMGKPTILMKFPAGGTYPKLIGLLPKKLSRVWHLCIRRYDPGFNIYGNGNGLQGAFAYKDGACTFENGKTGRENLVYSTGGASQNALTSCHMEANEGAPLTGGVIETPIGNLTTEFQSGNYFVEAVLYETPMNSVMQRRLFRFYVGTHPTGAPLLPNTIVSGVTNRSAGVVPLRMNAHQMFGLNMNHTPIIDLYKSVAEWYVADGSTYGDPWGLLGAQATPTLTGISGGTVTPGDTNKTITLTGTNFNANCYPEFSNPGIWARNDSANQSSNSATPFGAAPFTITPTSYTVVVDVDPNATPDGLSGTVLVRNYASGVATATQTVAVGTVTIPQAPTMSNATTVNFNTLTFPYTLNAAGGVPDTLPWQYRIAGSGNPFVAGGAYTLVSPALGGTGNATITLPASGTAYDVQFAASNAGGASAYSSTVTGTTAATPALITANLVLKLLSSAGLDVGTNGAGVGSWADQATTGVSWQQGTTSKKPTLVTNAYGSTTALRFVATSSQNLTTSAAVSALNTPDKTVYCIAAVRTDSPSSNQRILNNFTSNGGSSQEGYGLQHSSGGTALVGYVGSGAAQNNLAYGAVTQASGLHCFALTIDHTTPLNVTYLDGNQTATSSALYKYPQTAPGVHSIGSNNGSSGFGDVDVIAVFEYSVAHTATQIAQNTAYFKSVYPSLP